MNYNHQVMLLQNYNKYMIKIILNKKVIIKLDN